MAGLVVPGPQMRAPVVAGPQIDRVDVSSGAMALAESARTIETAQKARLLNDAQIGASKAFRDLDDELRRAPWDKKVETFEERSKDIRSTYLDGLGNAEVRQAFSGDFERLYGSYRTHTKDDAFKGETAHAIATAEGAVDGYARDIAFGRTPQEKELAKQNLRNSWTNLVAGGYIDEAQARDQVAKGLAAGDAYGANEMIRGNPWKAKQLLADPTNFPHLTANQISAFREEADGKARSRESEARERANAGSAVVASSMAVHINRFANGQGDFTQEALDEAKAAMKPQAFNQLQMAFDDARAARAKADAERVKVSAMIGAGLHIDPGNEKEVKAFDAYFSNNFMPELNAQVAKLPANQQADAISAATIDFIGKQGIVPETMMAGIRGSLRAGTPEERVEAARSLEQIKVVAPRTLDDFSDETIRQANMISAAIDDGVAPAEAARRAEEALKVSKTEAATLSEAYDAAVKTDPTDAWLSSNMGKGYWTSPTVPIQFTAEVSGLVRQEYQRNGGELEAARRTALDITKRRYGPTQVNGGWEVTRNPIEHHYGVPWLSPSANAAAIKAEAVAAMREGGFVDMPDRALANAALVAGAASGTNAAVGTIATLVVGPTFEERVRIRPYPVSSGVAAPDGRPVYALEMQDTSGVWSVVPDVREGSRTYGLPLPWYPSMAKVKEDRAAETQHAIDAAKAARELAGKPITTIMPGPGVQ